MQQPTNFWIIVKVKDEKATNEYPETFEEFSLRLSELARYKVNKVPFVGFPDSTKKSGIRWQKYNEYKKLRKKEEA